MDIIYTIKNSVYELLAIYQSLLNLFLKKQTMKKDKPKYCTICGTKKIEQEIESFDEATGEKNFYLICPNNCARKKFCAEFGHTLVKEDSLYVCPCGKTQKSIYGFLFGRPI